ncbi:hypothetical protein BEWA_035450 [Theileria equi strain WA]|uniref:Uncharacterized protein n=1 Tax=Theileria equi strain WA TaxID=1537102 RepID=L1LE02_THEEQ|nr:hypothetical protein BEWA_035450 [Theileria equi strain WA]EKX73509.1 hypothetical protein BEWA_035450 [Theileria equi strain WA]|eukprot:XP_004832961.1 hypothetical protein BEWA_035450 [Theileria equi strain WA]
MLSSMSRLGCRNIAILQNVSSHLLSLNPGLSLKRALQLSDILIAFKYIDKNYLEIITGVVCSVPQLIPSNEIIVLLKLLNLCKACNIFEINPHLLKTIVNMVIGDPSNVISAFATQSVFSELGYSNVYLDQLCNELSKVIPEYSVQERIYILDKCSEYRIDVFPLYNAVLNSLEVGDECEILAMTYVSGYNWWRKGIFEVIQVTRKAKKGYIHQYLYVCSVWSESRDRLWLIRS